MDPRYLASFAGVEDKHWWFRARREIVLDEMRLHARGPLTTLLDVGSGTGGNLAYFASNLAGCSCRGLDPDPIARAFCQRLGLDVVEGEATQLDVPSRSVDVVTILDVLEHVDEDALAVREAARVLRPGGLAILTVPAYMWMWGPHDELNYHKRRYLQAEVTRLICDAGLEVEKSTYFNSLLFPLAVVKRTAERLRRSHSAEERIPSGPTNWLLYTVFAWEAALLHRVRFPLGVSVMVIARKPLEAAGETHAAQGVAGDAAEA